MKQIIEQPDLLGSNKTFSMQHRTFTLAKPLVFTEASIPTWLLSTEFFWFLRDHVLPLEIGKSVDTDFQTITRIS